MVSLYPDEFTLVEPYRLNPDDPVSGYRAVRKRPQEDVDGLCDFEYFDPFLDYNSSVSRWLVITSGAGAGFGPSQAGIDSVVKAMGVVGIDTGSTSGGWCSMWFGSPAAVYPRSGYIRMDWRVSVSALSSTDDEYSVVIGLNDNAAGGPDATDGVYFEYVRTSNPNWVCVNAAGGTRTKLSSGVLPVASSTGYQWMTIECVPTSSGGFMSHFYIDGDQVGVIRGNYPTANTGIKAQIAKAGGAIGTTERFFYIDTFRLRVRFDRS